MKRRTAVILGLALIICALFLLAPATVALAEGHPEVFNYYLKALEYGLKGLQEYFNFIIELFKTAVSLA